MSVSYSYLCFCSVNNLFTNTDFIFQESLENLSALLIQLEHHYTFVPTLVNYLFITERKFRPNELLF